MAGEQIAARLLAAATNVCADTAVVVMGREWPRMALDDFPDCHIASVQLG
jgi:hypothetical protein